MRTIYIFIIILLFYSCQDKPKGKKITLDKKIDVVKSNCFDINYKYQYDTLSSGGCGGFMVATTISKQYSLVIECDIDSVKFDSCYVLNLEKKYSYFNIRVDYRAILNATYNFYCSDVYFVNAKEPIKLLPLKGELHFTINHLKYNKTIFKAYLYNGLFVNKGDTLKLNPIFIKEVNINNTPG